MVKTIRAFFDERDFVEVDTPVAAATVAPELYIDAPRVTLRCGATSVVRYLQTSPELSMKRLLAGELERIYQIAPVFRDGEYTALHRPEFRLLEWYRKDASVEELMSDCEELVRAVATAPLSYQGQKIALDGPWPRVSVEEACVRYAGFSLLARLDQESLAESLRDLGLHVSADDSWSDLFCRLLLERIEPGLHRDYGAVFLTDYPAPLASLARISPKDPRVAERFELYLGGLELANGYGELTSPKEQRRRFACEREARRALGLQDYPEDEEFFAALARLSPSAGIALGLDRLLMVLFDATDIDDVACIPWRPS